MEKQEVKKGGVKQPSVKTVRIALIALLALVAVVIGVIALVGGGSSDDEASAKAPDSGLVTLSEPELLAAGSQIGQPAYWLGHRSEANNYELTKTPDGRVYVRYLPTGTEAGDPRPDFVTIGTYPVPEAKRALRAASKTGRNIAEGMTLSHRVVRHEPYEALSSKRATSAYVVFDNQPDLQIEIFSPRVGEAALFAVAGSVKPLQ